MYCCQIVRGRDREVGADGCVVYQHRVFTIHSNYIWILSNHVQRDAFITLAYGNYIFQFSLLLSFEPVVSQSHLTLQTHIFSSLHISFLFLFYSFIVQEVRYRRERERERESTRSSKNHWKKRFLFCLILIAKLQHQMILNVPFFRVGCSTMCLTFSLDV